MENPLKHLEIITGHVRSYRFIALTERCSSVSTYIDNTKTILDNCYLTPRQVFNENAHSSDGYLNVYLVTQISDASVK